MKKHKLTYYIDDAGYMEFLIDNSMSVIIDALQGYIDDSLFNMIKKLHSLQSRINPLFNDSYKEITEMKWLQEEIKRELDSGVYVDEELIDIHVKWFDESIEHLIEEHEKYGY